MILGWDHGVFVPMLLINPPADVPIVQMSVLASESPEDHYKMGQALSALRDSNIAIIGSGFATFHNFRVLRSGILNQPEFRKRNDKWSLVVSDAVKEREPDSRLERFKAWRDWPDAYEMHPKGGAEHFLPLIVCAGAAGNGEAKSYSDEFMGLDIFSYYWE